MSGARFARSGRARFFLCFLALVLMLGMVAIFHNTTRQLDTSREQQLLCEQNQKTLNEQLQAIIEQKYTMQKNYNAERNEQMQTRVDLEQKLKKHTEQLSKEQAESHAKYEKLQQAHKLLQNEHKELMKKYEKDEHQHLEDVKALNSKLQDLQAKTQKEQTIVNDEVALWQEKYNTMVHEKQRLETLLNVGDSKNRIVQLEHIFAEYQTHCAYQPKGLAALQNNKPLDVPQIAAHNVAKSEHESTAAKKSFKQQVRVDADRYHININSKPTNTTLTNDNKVSSISPAAGDGLIGAIVLTTAAERIVSPQNHSLILNSVENFQILPKLYQNLAQESQASPPGAPHKPTSTEASKSKNKQQLDVAHNSSLAAQSPVSSTSGLPPLPLPPQAQEQQQQQQQARKLPENVAPIPEHFEDLLNNDEQQPPPKEENKKSADVNVADKPEQAQKERKDANNNRYANAVNDLSGKAKENDAAYVNEQSFNVPANNEDDNNNFFDVAETNNKANVANEAANKNANEDDLLANGEAAADVEAAAEVGDIDIKQKKPLLDADNVNNEVAGDQGKEFDDGLRLEEGIEEDADEDDYDSNLAARQQGEPAIRN